MIKNNESGARISVRGSAALKRKLESAGKNARAAKRRGLSKAGKFAVAELKSVAPVQSGSTKKSIGITRLVNESYTKDSIFIGVRKDQIFMIANPDRGKLEI